MGNEVSGFYTQNSMLDLMPRGMSQVSGVVMAPIVVRKALRAPVRKPKLVLRSRIPGRERWYVDLLEDNPRLAAAVELVLRSEEGIQEVRVNPLSGRVLVRCQIDSMPESVETLLNRAIAAGPMTREEFTQFRREQPRSVFSKQLLTTEIACSLSHLVLFGGLCPLGLAATGVLLLLHGRSRNHTHA
jgi:hypothetical protein